MQHDDRYALAEEYIKVTYKLWESSWRQDAVIRDRELGIYTDPKGVRQINHEGQYFTVPGPHLTQPSPQRTPVILQAGTSKAGKTFAAQHAEAIFVAGHSPAVVAKNVKEIRELAQSEFGRDPQSIKFLALLCPVLGKTESEAREKFEYYRSLGSIDGALALFGGWTGIDLEKYGDDEELRHVESNAIRYGSCFCFYYCDYRETDSWIDLLSRAGRRLLPRWPSGPKLPLDNISRLVGWELPPSVRLLRLPIIWSAGWKRLMWMDSTW
jgi:alkanesulfonate monooxygenase SsuD/methylene tetrahydromethanopterin reductase-like flavin-dependent oxidoreductase (luciferase family)